MSQIQILSEELISQIAAGEVVERPASVVKELVENAVDAAASRVTIEIDEGGMKRIRVVDDACGIQKEDVALAFERHATSKLGNINDLFHIGTLGFRGEALASIASIAKVVMETRTEGARVGTKYEVDGGRVLLHEETACPQGTDISVYGLFKHTPVRRKYMKTERTEYGRCFEMLCGIALAHPDVGFRLLRDGKEVLDLSPKQSLKERIRALYGGQTAMALVPVQYHQANMTISGFVGKPELARRGKKYQFLFVNGRAIEHRSVSHAVKEAFHSLLMHEKHPWYLLDIVMDPQLVDVNVHPRKLEVKFVNQQEVYRAVLGSVHHALHNIQLSPVMSSPQEQIENSPTLAVVSSPSAFSQAMPIAMPMHEERPHQVLFQLAETRLKPVAQIAHSYIVAESEEGLVLIDQHAAHERIRYAQLMEALEKEAVIKQPLLTPLEMDLGADSARLIQEHAADFDALGFEIEAFGGTTFLVRSIPHGIQHREPETVIRDILSDLEHEWKQNHVKNLREFLLTYTACRGAIKFGDPLTMTEMQALLRDMEKTEHCTHCPHGRPAMVTLSFDKLETLFKRKNF